MNENGKGHTVLLSDSYLGHDEMVKQILSLWGP